MEPRSTAEYMAAPPHATAVDGDDRRPERDGAVTSGAARPRILPPRRPSKRRVAHHRILAGLDREPQRPRLRQDALEVEPRGLQLGLIEPGFASVRRHLLERELGRARPNVAQR